MEKLEKSRLLAEIRAIDAGFPAVKMHDLEVGVPTFEVSLEIDDEVRHVRLTLPPGYPSVPPEVRELDAPGGRPIVPEGGMHRFPNGSVCLFTHGNDTQVWRRDLQAVDALRRFVDLVRAERAREGGRRPLYRGEERAFIPKSFLNRMAVVAGGWGQVRLRHARSGCGDHFADSLRVHMLPGLNAPLGLGWEGVFPGASWAFWVHVVSDGRSMLDFLAAEGELERMIRAVIPGDDSQRCLREGGMIVRSSADASRQVEVMHVRAIGDSLRAIQVAEVVVGTPEERLFHRNESVIRGRSQLSAARVILIGLGSLGGAVALALARAGIRRFVLIDPDRLSVENICRHVAPIHLVGMTKVDVVGMMLQGINPEVEVQRIAKYLAWDLPSLGAGQELEALLGDNDVIVNTCAIDATERQLNSLAVERGVPAIYGAALGAAEHARVFRVLPGESACYECILLAQERDPRTYPRFQGEGRPVGPAYCQPGLPGLAIDVTQIAMLIARLTLQTIARRTGADIGIADEVGHHLLWSNRGDWEVCDRALQVAVRDVTRVPDCPVCGEARRRQELRDEDARDLEVLLTKLGGK